MNINLIVKNKDKDIDNIINYVFRNEGGRVEWVPWGFDRKIASPAELKKVWKNRVMRKVLSSVGKKGRSPKRMAYHFTISHHTDVHFRLPFIYAVRNFVIDEFRNYSGVTVYHYKNQLQRYKEAILPHATVHAHVVVLPVHRETNSMLRVTFGDMVCLSNTYYLHLRDAIWKFMQTREYKQMVSKSITILQEMGYLQDIDSNIEIAMGKIIMPFICREKAEISSDYEYVLLKTLKAIKV